MLVDLLEWTETDGGGRFAEIKDASKPGIVKILIRHDENDSTWKVHLQINTVIAVSGENNIEILKEMCQSYVDRNYDEIFAFPPMAE
jgi:hypothetical protein